MTVILFDDQFRNNLLPLTYTRPVSEIRIGILTIAEKWNLHFNTGTQYLTEDYLQKKYPFVPGKSNLLINGSICPNHELVEAIDKLTEGDALIAGNVLIAAKLSESDVREFDSRKTDWNRKKEYSSPFLRISYPEDIFTNNHQEIIMDFGILTKGRMSASLSGTNTIIGENIFVEEGATAECATFNTNSGPIYLGRNSQVWEGSQIRGSFALCDESIVKMGAKIYGMTTIGPHSKAGGEINNAVIFGNSAKGHEGYLGNSVLGEWCNIGADTNNSNMKNNYAEVRLWDYQKQNFRRTGLQFCGLIMADHAKCGINTMFNTGTVVGVSANVFGSGFPRNFIPDFAWGGSQGFETYTLNKMFETAERVYERKDQVFGEIDKKILTRVFELSEKYRRA
ncbi:putative sugar nucleotidyl transferase [Daejeonella lutea]|uniref:UDP-N-acetylglucosamine diphosphorylase/glucosamine-1-phosphate N-acetyltransferase n=1 Tax=Daejeonella lutea TaxID=572036 RepID=A0A1T5B7N8_9SPHI|nr:putative sugar nucleotidyl transferase [Daejeonella lutea]SKB43175.1 UDP-N-acetylglucosamine diphosphorylase/glucosamine-1-phosphate N-acetyltransferase [Daejeonella lutea]